MLFLTELNCLLDRWFFAVYYLVLVGLFLHFLGNAITGRIADRFFLGHHKKVTPKEYILPFPRLMHRIHLAAMVALILTGFFIRYKVLSPHYLNLWKQLHYGFMGVIIANLAARIIYAFFGETKTYRDFAFSKRDILNTPEVIKYYLFLQDDYPHVAKFASLQKLTYNMFWVLLILQAITGMAILLPETFLGWINLSLSDSSLLMHIIHVVIMWFFIIATTIHVYMSVTEGYPLLKLMMFNIESDEGIEKAHVTKR